MRTDRYLISVIITCIIISGSADAEELNEYLRAETVMVASSGDSFSPSVFYIQAFGYLLPIPNRFVLMVGDPYQANYSSMSGIEFGETVVIGRITAGRHQLNSRTIFEIDSSSFARIGTDEEGIGLTIYEAGADPVKQIVISDGREYLLVTDQNAELWKAILKGARKLNEKGTKRGRRE
ncbi:MAG: hypothetical protein ACLGH6_14980 [Gammaproteobacteria bacterium]